MAIRYTEPGTHEMHAQLGQMVSQTQERKEQAARQDAIAQRGREMQHQMEMKLLTDELGKAAEKRAVEWEFQKMEMNSMRDYERKQMELDFWNIKKTEREAEQLDKYKQAVELVDGDDTIPPAQKPELLRRLKLKYLGMDVMPKPSNDPTKQLFNMAMQGNAQALGGGQEGEGMMQAQPEGPQPTIPIKTVSGMQVVERNGLQYRVVGMDEDGTPLVDTTPVGGASPVTPTPQATPQAQAQPSVREEIDTKREGMLGYPEFLARRKKTNSDTEYDKYQAYVDAYMNGEKNRASRIARGYPGLR